MIAWLPDIELWWWYVTWPRVTSPYGPTLPRLSVSTIAFQFAWDFLSLVTIPTAAFLWLSTVKQACVKVGHHMPEVPMCFSNLNCSCHRHCTTYEVLQYRDVSASLLQACPSIPIRKAYGSLSKIFTQCPLTSLLDPSTDSGSMTFDPLPSFVINLKALEK